MMSKGKMAPGESSRGFGDNGQDMCDENDVDTTSITQGTTESGKNKEKRKDKKKRKHSEAVSEPMIAMLGTFLERNNVAIEVVAARIAAKQAEAAAAVDKDTLVFQTVSNINGLPQDLKIFALFKIIEMKKLIYSWVWIKSRRHPLSRWCWKASLESNCESMVHVFVTEMVEHDMK